jgi:hypothetical protein
LNAACTTQKLRKRTGITTSLIPLNFPTITKRNDAAIGKVHVASRQTRNTLILRQLLGSHLGHGLISHLGRLGHTLRCLRSTTHLLAAVGLGHGQRHDVRIVLVQRSVLLQRRIWHLCQRGSDCVDVQHGVLKFWS